MVNSARHSAAAIFSVWLLLLPLAAWVEDSERETWQARLVIPKFAAEVARHTPREVRGTFLPPVISYDTTLTPTDNPVIIPGVTYVTAGTTLTLAAGTNVLVHEFGQLKIAGTLASQGNQANPVIFASNELHPDNQVWSGLVFTGSGHGTLAHTHFSAATPSITCMAGSDVVLANSTLVGTSLGVWIASSNCWIANSEIIGPRVGIMAVGVQPVVTQTRIQARHTHIQHIPVAAL